MRKLVIATHGKLAAGFKTTLEMLGSAAETLVSYGFYCDEDGVDDTLPARCFAELAPGDQLIVCTDIGFGSVNQAFLKEAVRHPDADVLIVTGVNLPLLLELSVSAGPFTHQKLQDMVDQARAQMGVVEVPQLAGATVSGPESGTGDGDFFD